MATRVSVATRAASACPTLRNGNNGGDADDRPVVDKVQLINDHADRRAEARWLAEARSDGVVRLLGVSDDPFTITTEHAGTATLRTAGGGPDRPATELAATLLAGVCDTLADLHDRHLVHGKLTLDHIILGTDGPVLCSPSGTADDHAVDVAALGACVDDLLSRWQAEGTNIDRSVEWRALCDALRDGEITSARRAARRFRRLVEPEPEIVGVVAGPRRLTRGLLTLMVALTVVLGGAIALGAGGQDRVGVEVALGGHRYSLGSPGDVAIGVATPCHSEEPFILLLDRKASIVWRFDQLADGARGIPLATVPGATALVVQSSGDEAHACQTAWVRGPAGATEIGAAAG